MKIPNLFAAIHVIGSLAVILPFGECYQPTSVVNRRRLLNAVVASVAAPVILNTDVKEANAVISSKYCAYGEGDGCETLAEGNPFILELQQRSAANKVAIQTEAKNAYYMKNYPDFFAAVGKNMVKKTDGTFMVVDDAELQQLTKENKLTLEYPKAMGGKVADLTQKPILVLKE